MGRRAGIPEVDMDAEAAAQMHKYAALNHALIENCELCHCSDADMKAVDVHSLIHGLVGGVLNTTALVDETELTSALVRKEVSLPL